MDVNDVPFCLTGVVRWPGPRPTGIGGLTANPSVLSAIGTPSVPRLDFQASM